MLTSPTHSASSCIATRLKPAWRNLVCSMSRSSTSRCSVQDHGSVTIQAPTPVTGCGRRRTNYNKFTVIGCNTLAHIGRVVSVCHNEDSLVDDSCSGIGRCQTSIPENLTYYDVQFDANFNSSSIWEFSPCSHAMMLEASWFKFHEPSYITTNQLQNKTDGWAPMGVDWAIGNETCEVAVLNQNSYACISATSVCLNSTNGPGYLRNCSSVLYFLTPQSQQNLAWKRKENQRTNIFYVPCLAGTSSSLAFLLLRSMCIYMVYERRRFTKDKGRCFEEHGGWPLLEEIKGKQGVAFKTFTNRELEQATNRFDDNRVLGRGGYGVERFIKEFWRTTTYHPSRNLK
ncbi:unnamed protein product [Musa textilis]